jgi:polyribonucleotide nucleotidyltransferase
VDEGRVADVSRAREELADGKIKDALNQKDKHGRIAAVEKVKKEVAEQLLVDFPDNSKDVKALLATSSTTACATRCCRADSASTAASRTKSAIYQSTLRCCRARTARRCSPAARPRRSFRRRSAPPRTRSVSIRSRSGEVTRSFMLHYTPAVLDG